MPLDPHKPSRPPSASAAADGALERSLHRLFFIVLTGATLGFTLWLNHLRHTEVVSSRPIGGFVRMSGPGGWQGRVVIETDAGSFPLRRAVVIAKGTALAVELRVSGERYVCDESRSLCIETAAQEFDAPQERAQ